MRRALSLLRLAVTLSLALPACATVPEGVPAGARSRLEPKAVEVRALPGDRVRLVFEPVAPDPVLERVRIEEARAVLAEFHASLLREEGRRLRLVRTSTQPEPAEWERRLREEFVSRYGPPGVALPWALETSPVLMALKLSPPYMGEGVREAARELFRSPVFLSSVALSVLVYFAAWVAPEPLFTKAFVTALTLRLALLVGVVELNRFARACARLYEEAQAARTVEELEAVAERFGRVVGGTGLRVMMLAASIGVAKGLLVYLKGHKGPHPEEYHQEVHQRLQRALGQCRTTAQCRAFLMEALKSLADEVCTDGSRLHRLLTKSGD